LALLPLPFWACDSTGAAGGTQGDDGGGTSSSGASGSGSTGGSSGGSSSGSTSGGSASSSNGSSSGGSSGTSGSSGSGSTSGSSSNGGSTSSGGGSSSGSGAGSSSSGSGEGEAGSFAFADEFDGTSIDTTLWNVMNEHSDVTNNEADCYAPANVAVSGGYLNETAMAQSASCLNAMGAPAGPAGGMLSEMYTSGAIQMKSFSFLHGTVEVRAKFAGGTTWPAIWMLGAYCQYPTWLYGVNSHGSGSDPCMWHNPGSDEIDIAEIFSGASTVNETIQGDNGCQPTPPMGTPQDWHVYTLNWTSASVEWLIDGVSQCMLTQNVPAHPMFLIINTTVGGAGGGTPDPSTLPQTTSIDYVHVTTNDVATM
jgi:hypothetical protein